MHLPPGVRVLRRRGALRRRQHRGGGQGDARATWRTSCRAASPWTCRRSSSPGVSRARRRWAWRSPQPSPAAGCPSSSSTRRAAAPGWSVSGRRCASSLTLGLIDPARDSAAHGGGAVGQLRTGCRGVPRTVSSVVTGELAGDDRGRARRAGRDHGARDLRVLRESGGTAVAVARTAIESGVRTATARRGSRRLRERRDAGGAAGAAAPAA